MTPTDTALLDAVADCLESGDTLLLALQKVATAKGAAARWAQRVGPAARAGIALAEALRQANVLDGDELLLVSATGDDRGGQRPDNDRGGQRPDNDRGGQRPDDDQGGQRPDNDRGGQRPDNDRGDGAGATALHAVALRRRRSLARRRGLRWALVVPFALGALTAALDPVPELLTGGAYVWPALRGLLCVVVLTLAAALGVPALLRDPRARRWVLRLCTALPGAARFAALYAEEELTTALAAFVDGGEVRSAGIAAAASLLSWSPMSQGLRLASRSISSVSSASSRDPRPMAGLEPLAHELSLATSLAVVGGVASRRLAQRLAERGEAIAALLTARLRLVVRIGAYALLFAFSISSLVSMASRGLAGLPGFPGGATSPDPKELQDLMKQLEQ
jgi:hypothetical protein